MWRRDVLAELKDSLAHLGETMASALQHARDQGAAGTGEVGGRGPRRARGSASAADIPSMEQLSQAFLSAHYGGRLQQRGFAENLAEMVRLRRSVDRSAIEDVAAAGGMTNGIKNAQQMRSYSFFGFSGGGGGSQGPPMGAGLGAFSGGFGPRYMHLSSVVPQTPPISAGGYGANISSFGRAAVSQFPARDPWAVPLLNVSGGSSAVAREAATSWAFPKTEAAAAAGPLRGITSAAWQGMAGRMAASKPLSAIPTGNVSGALKSGAAAGLAVTAGVMAARYMARQPERQVESQRPLAEFSGSMAGIFANYDMQRGFQQRRLGDMTAGSTALLASAVLTQKQEGLQRQAFQSNLASAIGIGFAGFMTAAERDFKGVFEGLNQNLKPESAWGWMTSAWMYLRSGGLQLTRPGEIKAPEPLPTTSPLGRWLSEMGKQPLTNDLRPAFAADNPTRPWPGSSRERGN